MERKIQAFGEHEYFVDIPRDALVRVDDPEMVIHLRMTEYHENQGYRWGPGIIPELVKLDPEGMSEHYRFPLSQLKGKSDYEVIVNQRLVERRLAGKLPELNIMGHTFYVDVRMGALRPKDDFSTAGISFREIDEFFDFEKTEYRFSYHPDSHTFRVPDLGSLIEVPKDIFLITIPHKGALDPIGFARERGLDMRQILRKEPPYEPMKAQIIPWEETKLEERIISNRAAKGLPPIDIGAQAKAARDSRIATGKKPKLKNRRRL